MILLYDDTLNIHADYLTTRSFGVGPFVGNCMHELLLWMLPVDSNMGKGSIKGPFNTNGPPASHSAQPTASIALVPRRLLWKKTKGVKRFSRR